MGIEQDHTIKNRRVTQPHHIRNILTEQLNILRKIVPSNQKEALDKARTIAYISNTSLMSLRDGLNAEKLKEIEDMLTQLLKEETF